MNNQITELAFKLGQQLQMQNSQVATAESCTGGGLAYAITQIAGSSNWFEVGFVTYSNLQKNQQLNVAMPLFEKFGAVSSEVAVAMAQGVQMQSKARFSVAITGIAGPSGGSDLKPVGTVWFGFGEHQNFYSKKQLFSGCRVQIREQAIIFALQELVQLSSQLYA